MKHSLKTHVRATRTTTRINSLNLFRTQLKMVSDFAFVFISLPIFNANFYNLECIVEDVAPEPDGPSLVQLGSASPLPSEQYIWLGNEHQNWLYLMFTGLVFINKIAITKHCILRPRRRLMSIHMTLWLWLIFPIYAFPLDRSVIIFWRLQTVPKGTQ